MIRTVHLVCLIRFGLGEKIVCDALFERALTDDYSSIVDSGQATVTKDALSESANYMHGVIFSLFQLITASD